MTVVPTSRSVLALIGLLLVSAAWGSSFPLTKVLLEDMTPVGFLAVRFCLAGALMLVVFHRQVRALPRRALWHGVALGLLYGVAQMVQTTGLAHTSASVSGFLTGTYVVLTPILAAALLRTTIGARVWVGAVLATIGLALLALNGFAIGFGEAITLASAVLYALHIIGLGSWSTGRTALGLATVQIAVVGVVCLLTALVTDPSQLTLPTTGGQWLSLVYMAVVSGAIAMIVQSWAQAYLSASRAAIIMSSEPAWAAAFSITFLHEPLTWRIGLGGLVMLAAMVIVETGPRRGDDPTPHPDEVPKLAA